MAWNELFFKKFSSSWINLPVLILIIHCTYCTLLLSLLYGKCHDKGLKPVPKQDSCSLSESARSLYGLWGGTAQASRRTGTWGASSLCLFLTHLSLYLTHHTWQCLQFWGTTGIPKEYLYLTQQPSTTHRTEANSPPLTHLCFSQVISLRRVSLHHPVSISRSSESSSTLML